MKKTGPSKADTALLPAFAGLPLEAIHVPATPEQFAAAAAEIAAAGVVGFDTESKPTFVTGDVSRGPHVVQFALSDKAYIFQVHREEGRACLIELLQSRTLIKAGFGLKSDSGQTRAKFGVELGALLDLNEVFRLDGYSGDMGVRAAVGLVMQQNFPKSKHVTTSNWALRELGPKQLLYAANDAYAALKVLQALDRPHADLPIRGLAVK